MEEVREDSSAAVCAWSSLVSSRCHCTSGDTICLCTGASVTSWIELISVHWTEGREAMLCLCDSISEACEKHEDTLCLGCGECTAGQSDSVEAIRAAAAAAGDAAADEAGKGKPGGANCTGGRLSASCGSTARPACKAWLKLLTDETVIRLWSMGPAATAEEASKEAEEES